MKTENKVSHTPGPWIVTNLGEGKRGASYGLVIQGRDVNPILTMPSGERNEANARLISAAPNMYLLLRAILISNLLVETAYEKKVDEILAKVEGG